MSSQKDMVSRQFDPRALAYLESPVHALGPDLDEMVASVGINPDWSALDLGCGGGHTSFRLSPLVKSVTAYDLSERMLGVVVSEAHRKSMHNIVTQQGAVESMPFAAGSFDLLATRFSAHHWCDMTAALAEMRRVTKKGSTAVVMDAIAPESPLLDTWLQSLELLRDPSHVRNYSMSQWRVMLEKSGFTVESERMFRLRLDFASWIERMKTPQERVIAIKSLETVAGAEVARHFNIGQDGSFTIDTALLCARAT